jgi:hypothetical protein
LITKMKLVVVIKIKGNYGREKSWGHCLDLKL